MNPKIVSSDFRQLAVASKVGKVDKCVAGNRISIDNEPLLGIDLEPPEVTFTCPVWESGDRTTRGSFLRLADVAIRAHEDEDRFRADIQWNDRPQRRAMDVTGLGVQADGLGVLVVHGTLQ